MPDPTRRNSPGDHRPDVRPMIVLLALLVAVVLGWLVLSPLILPAAA